MQIKPIASNMTELTFTPKETTAYGDFSVLYSYSTPVAGYKPNIGYVKTNQWYSSTTTRHINRYLNEYCDVPNPDSIPTVDPSEITNLVPIPVRY